MQLRRMETILQNMISLTVARSNLSDVADTSSFKKVLAASSREIDEAYYQMTRLNDLFDLQKAAGEDLDERAKEIQPGTLKRIQALRAIGSVVLSRFNSTIGDVVIPNGTVLKTADGKVFRTTLQGVILNTQNNSAAISVTADVAGAAGNVSAATIVKFGSKIPGVDAVSNPAGLTQGRDKEADDSFRARIINFISSLARCPPQALEFAAVGTSDPVTGKTVVFAHVFEDPVTLGLITLFVDDGAGTAGTLGAPIPAEVVTAGLAGPPPGAAVGGEEFLSLAFHPLDIDTSPFVITSNLRGALVVKTTVFVNPASGRLFFNPPLAPGEIITAQYTPWIDLIPVVQKVIDGDVDDRTNFPGYRAGGVLVRVLPPVVTEVQVQGVLTVASGVDRPTAITGAQNAIQDYINNLGISGDVVRNKLIEVIMEVSGVTDVNLTVPLSNVIILDEQIPRTNLANINIT